MKHLPFNHTPLVQSKHYSELFDCNFYIKREDLLFPAGGGSKARMLQYILYKAIQSKSDYIVTAGGPYSNFNRSLALMCAQLNLKMCLVIYNKNEHIEFESINKRICDICDVEFIFTSPDTVAETIDKEIEKLINQNHNPYFIWGGGKSNEGVQAYIDCVQEIKENNLIEPDFIFTALGTGTTFSGLTLGAEKHLNNAQVYGISVARDYETANQVVNSILKEYDSSLKPQKNKILTEYLMGGYGKKNADLESFIKNAIKKEGLILDEIYVGKALFGSIDFIRKNVSEFKGKNVVFINTGGLYNF